MFNFGLHLFSARLTLEDVAICLYWQAAISFSNCMKLSAQFDRFLEEKCMLVGFDSIMFRVHYCLDCSIYLLL